MMTDPIADMLTRIRNAQVIRKSSVSMPLSKVKKAIAELLHAEGYIDAVKDENNPTPTLVLSLKYSDGEPAIREIKRESKPGHRMYRKADEMPRILNDYGIAVVSTSAGLMTNKDARQKGIGGEIICSVY
ncbi:MAG: 30S ribosomal protein S8 [Candidatus Magasanikbacteria bacterium]|nr:30S ribosomal protein S8 [Candidatus Magasanikbacteria bacterium]